MKPIAVFLWSVVGMAATSSTVAWMTPPEPSPVESRASVSAPKTDVDEETLASRSSASETTTVVAEPAIPSEFTEEGLLRVEGRLGHASAPTGRALESFVLVEVDAPREGPGEDRAPVDVAIVVDRSGSMKGERLRNAVAAARGMVDRLGPRDRVSLVAYHGEAELLLPSTPVERLDRGTFERTLAGLRHGGHTCISCGLELGLAQLRGRGEAGRVLLLSDGKANRGMTTPAALRGLGDAARREGTAIASIGVDVDYDERTLFAVSEASNGRHYFVEDPRGLPAVFEQEREALVGTVAERTEVDVTLADGIELLEVVDRPHRRRGDTVSLSLGSFASGDAKTVLLRVLVRPEADLGSRAVASVSLRYRDRAVGGEHRHAGELGMVVASPEEPPATLDPAVEARLGRKEAFDALVAANEAFGRGDLAVAERTLEQARSAIRRRRSRSADAPEPAAPKVDADFDRQLEALGSASANFEEASAGVPATAAPKKRKGKKATRLNLQAADPFSD